MAPGSPATHKSLRFRPRSSVEFYRLHVCLKPLGSKAKQLLPNGNYDRDDQDECENGGSNPRKDAKSIPEAGHCYVRHQRLCRCSRIR
jgi:hypothetical protein